MAAKSAVCLLLVSLAEATASSLCNGEKVLTRSARTRDVGYVGGDARVRCRFYKLPK